MNTFFKSSLLLSALASSAFLAAPALADCLSGPLCVTSTTIAPEPIAWGSMVEFSGEWSAQTNGLAQGIGDEIDAVSNITESYVMNSLGSIMVDPNCEADCGDQTFTSNFDLHQQVNNDVTATSFGAGTLDAPIIARSGTASMGGFSGMMEANVWTGIPLTVAP